MPKADYDMLHLTGDWLCDVELLPAPDSPGAIDSPWGATNVGYIASGDFSGPKLNGRVLPGGGDWPALSIDGKDSYQDNQCFYGYPECFVFCKRRGMQIS